MDRVVFYHTVRKDRGERTGLSVSHRGEHSEGFNYFMPGKRELNPIILWAFDVIVKTKSAPKTRSEAKAWLRKNVGMISESLLDVASQLASGLDADGAPWQLERKGPAGIVRVSIHATTSHTGRDIAKQLLNFVRTKLDSVLENVDREEARAVNCV